ncbi:adenosylcobinamide-GDP ribazoletransferase, partial [Pseudomonas kuykendallii]|uniref:adenosylcobinamide-GDP ribazoletransferase n=1 Tax=Pseudomonas kuykendallii TaxID=1007099 RepID=UPI0028D0031F
LVLVLLLKFAALLALLQQGDTQALFVAPILARATPLALFLTTPYVRQGGLGQALADHLPRHAARYTLAVTALGVLVIAGWSGVGALLLAAALFAYLRRAMMKRLGGCTGDTVGAVLELVEVGVLVGLAL